MLLDQWAKDWNMPAAALQDLRNRMGHFPDEPTLNRRHVVGSEDYTQSITRLQLSERGALMFRNNVGALQDDTGRLVRYGLANDSKAMNDQFKSSDLIGCLPVVIQPWHVGTTIGQFVAVENKHGGWKAGEKPAHEAAQQRFGDLILARGGRFAFSTGNVAQWWV